MHCLFKSALMFKFQSTDQNSILEAKIVELIAIDIIELDFVGQWKCSQIDNKMRRFIILTSGCENL